MSLLAAARVAGDGASPGGCSLDRWWPELPWQAAEQTPVMSTGLPEELQARIGALAALSR